MIDINSLKNIFFTTFLLSVVFINTSYASDELIYRYKVNGMILGEKIIIPNAPPVIDEEPLDNGSNGVSYNYTLKGFDKDQDVLTWSWSGEIPAGFSLNSTTGVISGKPTLEGVYNLNISVSDGVHDVDMNKTIEIFGCTNGELGTICGDGTVYAGTVDSKRMYLLPHFNGYPNYTTGNKPYEGAENICQGINAFIPNVAQVKKIYENHSQLNLYNYRLSRAWTSEHVPTKSHPEFYRYSVSYTGATREDYIYGVQNPVYCIHY